MKLQSKKEAPDPLSVEDRVASAALKHAGKDAKKLQGLLAKFEWSLASCKENPCTACAITRRAFESVRRELELLRSAVPDVTQERERFP